MHIPQLSPAELQRRRQDGKAFLLLNVRTDEKTAVCTLSDSAHTPINLIPLRGNELSDGLPIVVYCHHDIHSLHTAMCLADAGFETLYSLQSGIDAQAAQIDENMVRYQRVQKVQSFPICHLFRRPVRLNA